VSATNSFEYLRDRLEGLAVLRRDLLPFRHYSSKAFNGLAALGALDKLT